MTSPNIAATFAPHVPALVACARERFALVRAIYLFGSVLSPHFSARSDVDVCIDVADDLTEVERFDVENDLSLALRCDVDLIVFRHASAVLRYQILTTGIRVFAANESAQDAYEAAVLTEYLDFNFVRAQHLEDMRIRGRVYG